MRKYITVIVLALVIGAQVNAQVITVKERKSDNELIDVKQPYFVDINSMLTLEINKDSVLLDMAAELGVQTYPKELLRLVNSTLRQHQKILSAINAQGDRRKRLDALKTFRTSLSPLLTYLVTNQDSLQGTPLYQAINTAFSTPDPDYGPVFSALNAQYKAVTSEYADKVNKSSAYFKLGGWLNTKDGATQFHIPGFDSLTENGIVTIPRFTTSVPPEEAQAYDEARNLADSINTNIDGFLSMVKEGVKGQISDVENKVTIILDGAYTTMENDLNDLASGVKNKFDGPVSTLKQDLNNFKLGVVKLVNDIENAKLSTSTLTTLAQDADTLYKQAKAIEALGDSIWNIFDAEVKSLPSVASQLKTEITNDIQKVITQLKDLGQPYLDEARNLMNLLSENRVADLKETAANFSSSTFALSYDNIPKSAEVDLRRVGADRKAGDQIYFKAVIVRDSTDGGFNKSLFWRKYTMFHMGIYNSIRASVVFLDKVNGDFAGSNSDFQLAPSYSAIFKIGTRKGRFYNQYLTPGLGVNVATMDFNNDNTPEIGLGVTAAFFHDYLQVGYGMNTNDNYWMLGLRLPLFGWATSAVQGTPTTTPALGN